MAGAAPSLSNCKSVPSSAPPSPMEHSDDKIIDTLLKLLAVLPNDFLVSGSEHIHFVHKQCTCSAGRY